MTHPAIRCERDAVPHIGRIVVARPEAANAVTTDMVAALRDAFARFAADDSIKVIFIAAEGSDLTRGFDACEAEAMYRNAPGGSVKKVPSQRARLAAHDALWWGPDGLYTRVLHCPKVTLLAARGLCLEIGLYLALCCDLVLADDTARFGNPRWQHVGVDGDISMLVAAVGLKRAKELLLFGAQWDARQALQYGLIDEVVEPQGLEAAARNLAAFCTQVMRDGIAAEKHVVFASLAKMQICTGFATAAAVGAWASNVHFRPGEFNFLREMRDHGLEAALAAAERHFSPAP
ncbi:MAG TPA: enoyl-CoA hydratase/isomerase family protein [Ramlibacter sp.]|uniref:enoyl-CoA hydratase/isomerase family protein n=1 Tax=Ramlibacter sp. TaxID=1917967 RepID=UPI002C7528BA|nr:enoyl-CoA hydratase/isomerase family protein [Ramlibacter sp.]HVZ42221.1 enoyl-CoA hydratase/isomerase family protein [Ramlibacter sp.]